MASSLGEVWSVFHLCQIFTNVIWALAKLTWKFSNRSSFSSQSKQPAQNATSQPPHPQGAEGEAKRYGVKWKAMALSHEGVSREVQKPFSTCSLMMKWGTQGVENGPKQDSSYLPTQHIIMESESIKAALWSACPKKRPERLSGLPKVTQLRSAIESLKTPRNPQLTAGKSCQQEHLCWSS